MIKNIFKNLKRISFRVYKGVSMFLSELIFPCIFFPFILLRDTELENRLYKLHKLENNEEIYFFWFPNFFEKTGWHWLSYGKRSWWAAGFDDSYSIISLLPNDIEVEVKTKNAN